MTFRAGRRRPTSALLLAALAVVTCTSVGAAPSDEVPRCAVEVVVIGDSLSTGAHTPGDPWTLEAQQVTELRERKVVFVNDAQNGSGYVTEGAYGDTFADQVQEVVSARSDVVLVFGSDNDLGQAGLATAANHTLSLVRARAPRAELIVVGPPAPPAQDPRQLATIRDTLAEATARADGRFVDPLTLKWFQGASAAYVGDDAEHPNAAGERFLGERMTAILAPVVDRIAARRIASASRQPKGCASD